MCNPPTLECYESSCRNCSTEQLREALYDTFEEAETVRKDNHLTKTTI